MSRRPLAGDLLHRNTVLDATVQFCIDNDARAWYNVAAIADTAGRRATAKGWQSDS